MITNAIDSLLEYSNETALEQVAREIKEKRGERVLDKEVLALAFVEIPLRLEIVRENGSVSMKVTSEPNSDLVYLETEEKKAVIDALQREFVLDDEPVPYPPSKEVISFQDTMADILNKVNRLSSEFEALKNA